MHFSLFLAVVYILHGIGAAGLDVPFTMEVVTAVENNTTECSLVDAMELKFRLASSFQKYSRKFFHSRVVLKEFYVVEGGNDDGGRELLTRTSTALTKAKERVLPTQGMLRGQSRHERQLVVWTWIQLTVKGKYICRLCPIDNGDLRKLSGPTTSFEEYMSEFMTKDLQTFIIKKSLNGTTPSCFGDKDSVFVDFALFE